MKLNKKIILIIIIHIILIFIFSIINHFCLTKDDFKNGDTIDSFMDTFYHTLITHSSIGYGDIYPLSKRARIISSSMY